MKLPYKEFGTGKPLILIHAFPLSSSMWEPNIDELTKIGCKLFLPDMRGFGENINFADINLVEDMAGDVAELIETLGIERSIIGGLSMGGYITFNLYRLHPEKFSAMILCDTNFSNDSIESKQKRLELIDEIEALGNKALIEKMLPNLISDSTKIKNKTLVSELINEFKEVEPQSAIAALRGMAERIDHSNILDKINVPTLLVFGESDKITNLEIATEMNSKIPNSKLNIIKDAGHYSNLEKPTEFNSVLTNFINNL